MPSVIEAEHQEQTAVIGRSLERDGWACAHATAQDRADDSPSVRGRSGTDRVAYSHSMVAGGFELMS
jgi:hypothetical protein